MLSLSAALLLAALLSSDDARPGLGPGETGESGSGATWARFRGPNGSGVVEDGSPLPTRLDPEAGLAWSAAVPPGHSSPCVAGGRIFLTGHEEGRLLVLALDRKTGEELWRQTFEPLHTERLHRVNDAAAPTPCADGERVIVSFGGFGILCFDHAGRELWRRPLPAARNTFGSAASPILAGNKLIFVRDTQDSSWIEAIDKTSGETLWRTERDGYGSGWSTPIVRSSAEAEEVVVYGVWWLTAYDLTDGSQRWSVPGLSDEPIVTPTLFEDRVLVSSYNMRTSTEAIGLPTFAQLLEELDEDGDGKLDREEASKNESVLSRFDAEGEGDHPLRIFFNFLDEARDGFIDEQEWQKLPAWLNGFEHANAMVAIAPERAGSNETDADDETVITGEEVVWQFPRGVPECPSPLVYGERVYMVKNGGMLTCLDAHTGELVYEGRLGARGPWYSSPVAGDGKIYAASAGGVVTVFAAGDRLEVLSRFDSGERIMATPALADGHVYLRTEKRILAFRR